MHAPLQRDWVRDAIARSVDEGRAFVATAWAFTSRPGRFAIDWTSGRSGALNPLGMLATGAAVLSAARALLELALGRGANPQGLLEAVRDAVAPFLHYMVLGILAHAVLRAIARSRRRLTDSLAMALFAGGGPGVASTVVVYVVGAVLWIAAGKPDVIHAGLLGSLPAWAARPLLYVAYAAYALFLATLLWSLRALHGAAAWQAALALALAVFVVGIAFGLKPADVTFGTRVLVRFHPLRAMIWVD